MHVTHKNLLQWISAFEVQKLAFTENTVLIFYKKNMDKLPSNYGTWDLMKAAQTMAWSWKPYIIYLPDILLKTGLTSQIFL